MVAGRKCGHAHTALRLNDLANIASLKDFIVRHKVSKDRLYMSTTVIWFDLIPFGVILRV